MISFIDYSKSSSSKRCCKTLLFSVFWGVDSSSTIFRILVFWEFLFAPFHTSIKLIIRPISKRISIIFPPQARVILWVVVLSIPSVSVIPIKALAITQRKAKLSMGSLSLNPRKFTTNPLKRIFIFHPSKKIILEKIIIIDLK